MQKGKLVQKGVTAMEIEVKTPPTTWDDNLWSEVFGHQLWQEVYSRSMSSLGVPDMSAMTLLTILCMFFEFTTNLIRLVSKFPKGTIVQTISANLSRSTNTRVVLLGDPDAGKSQSISAIKSSFIDCDLQMLEVNIIGKHWLPENVEKNIGVV
jgi:hypothetical protein